MRRARGDSLISCLPCASSLPPAGGSTGARIFHAEYASLAALWERVCLPVNDPARGNLPKRCTREWYLSTFCGGAAVDTYEFRAVWPTVRSVNLYSPIALIAALPYAYKTYFRTKELSVRSAMHHIIGVNADELCVTNARGLRLLFVQGLYMSSVVNESEFTQGLPPPISITFDDDDEPSASGPWAGVEMWDFGEQQREVLRAFIIEQASFQERCRTSPDGSQGQSSDQMAA